LEEALKIKGRSLLKNKGDLRDEYERKPEFDKKMTKFL
jgi:hypothetical protein